ncbi:MAG: electron transport complex subunit RsxC, partial [Clostridia bacterium]|nr:electron transport complex subunit RsxC [Clostridia bacterium]
MSKKTQGVLSAVRRGRGGVRVSHSKNTAEMPVERMPIPSKVVISMQQHIGVPCTPLVKVGDTVAVGQKIGDSDKFVSAPIHATVSGKVTAVGDIKLANGIITKGVTI